MENKIEILSVLKYTDKKTGEIKTRLGFIFEDEKYLVQNKSFKGYSELSCFYNGDKVFEMLTPDMFRKPIKCTILVENNPSNPLKTTSKVEKLVYGNNVYNLL